MTEQRESLSHPNVHCRTAWISDAHLGSRGCQAGALADFLRHLYCERLYLVGDIVDFWRMKSRPYWPREHNDVLRRMLKLVKHGTEVILIPGNHDEALRQYGDPDFGGILVRHQHIHGCLDGRRLLITHGDQYDLVVKHSRLLSLIGSAAYEWLIVINRFYNRYRRWRGKPYWSLAQYLKLKVKGACTYVSRFRDTLELEAERDDLDGVVCGHIHQPEIDEDDFSYYNCGDWIENCTALIEQHTGEIELIRWHDTRGDHSTFDADGWSGVAEDGLSEAPRERADQRRNACATK